MRAVPFVAYAVLWLACSGGLQIPAWAEVQSRCGLPVVIADGWQIGDQGTTIANPERLCALRDKLAKSNSPSVHAVVLVRNGTLLFEHYRKGYDEKWGRPIGEIQYAPDVRHDVRSISKSVVSLLVGIAVDRGLIRSVDEPVFTFFPEFASLRTPEKDRILVRHLLTMSSGIKWDEERPYTDPENSEIKDDLRSRFLSLCIRAADGGRTRERCGIITAAPLLFSPPLSRRRRENRFLSSRGNPSSRRLA